MAEQSDLMGHNVISTIELESPFFHDMSEGDYTNFFSFLSKLKQGVVWLTRAAQIECSNPGYGMALGLARTIRAELSLRCWTVELANLHNHVRESNAVIAIFRKFVNSSLTDGPVDCEYSVLDGQVHTGRYHWSHLPSELKPILKQDDPKELSIGQFGMLQSLHWVHQRSVELEPDEVEIDIRCVGVNFKVSIPTMEILGRKIGFSKLIKSKGYHAKHGIGKRSRK
jgi:hypothetical protein